MLEDQRRWDAMSPAERKKALLKAGASTPNTEDWERLAEQMSRTRYKDLTPIKRQAIRNLFRFLV